MDLIKKKKNISFYIQAMTNSSGKTKMLMVYWVGAQYIK